MKPAYAQDIPRADCLTHVTDMQCLLKVIAVSDSCDLFDCLTHVTDMQCLLKVIGVLFRLLCSL